MKKLLLVALLPLLFFCCKNDFEEDAIELRSGKGTAVTDLAILGKSAQSYYRDKVLSSDYYTSQGLSKQTLRWDMHAFYWNARNDRVLSVSFQDPEYGASRYLQIFVFDQKTATVKDAYFIRFNPTQEYYAENKTRNYDLFTGTAEVYTLSGTRIDTQEFQAGSRLSVGTKVDIDAIDVWGKYPWKCTICGYFMENPWSVASSGYCPACGADNEKWKEVTDGSGGGGDGGGGGNVNPGTPNPYAYSDNDKVNTTLQNLMYLLSGSIEFVFSDCKNKGMLFFLSDYNIGRVAETAIRFDPITGKATRVEIHFNPSIINSLNRPAVDLIMVHEMFHIYYEVTFGKNSNDGDHYQMIYNPYYVQCLKQVFYGSDSYFEKLKYAGTQGSPVYDDLPAERQEELIEFFKEKQIYY